MNDRIEAVQGVLRRIRPLAASLGVIALATLLGACSRSDTPPPSIDLGRLEVPLANRLRQLTQAVEAEPRSASAWGRLGSVYDVHDLFNEAIPCYERAAELDPADFRWPYFLGICKQLGDRTAALAHFEAAVDLKPRHAPLLYLIGNVHLQAGDLTDAIAAFERALEQEPRLIVAHLGLAKVAITNQDGEGALAHLRTAAGLGPKTNEILGLFEQAYRIVGDDEEADHQAQLAGGMTRLEPISDPLRFELRLAEGVTLARRREKSYHLMEHGDLNQVLEIWDAAAAEEPGSYDVHLQAAHVKSKAGRFDLAVESYRAAMEIDDTAETHLGLGNALLQMRDVPAATAELRRAIDIDANLHEARLNLGFLVMGEGQEEGRPKMIAEGLELIEDACAGLPNEPDAHFNLAQAYMAEGRRDEAFREYAIVVQIQPHHYNGRMAYGTGLAAAGNLAVAAIQFEEATHANSHAPQPYDRLSLALHGLGRHDEERMAIETGLRRIPGHLVLRRRLGWILATCPDDGVRDGERAVELAQQLCVETQRRAPSALHVLAVAYAEQGDFEQAQKCTNEAVALLDAKPQLSPREAAHKAELLQLLEAFAESKPHRSGN